MATQVKRDYGKEQSFGDILYNNKTKTVFFSIDGGIFGRKTILLAKNQEGTYDMFGTYFQNGENMTYRMGKTFEVLNSEKQVVQGLTKGTLGLSTKYSQELQREITSTENAIFIVTHKLKEVKQINEDLVKIGWVTGNFGIESKPENQYPQQEGNGYGQPAQSQPAQQPQSNGYSQPAQQPQQDVQSQPEQSYQEPTHEVDEDEIPF